jgi:predicted dehydrogenase
MSGVHIGVVGAGLIGRKHIDVLRSGNREFMLAGVADPSPVVREEAQRLGYPCFETVALLLDEAKPDGVIVAVPNQLHVAMGLACVEQGIPIIIEKPVAPTVEEAMKLVTAAEAADVPTLVGHHRRHNPIMQRAVAAIGDGAIGKVVTATALWLAHKPKGYHDLAWRREPGGGPVLINAIHDIDCLRMLCGDIETVQASASNAVRGLAVEDTAAAVLTFKNGALGTLIVSDTVSSPWSWECTSGENPAFPKLSEDCILVGGTRGALAVPTLDVRWQTEGEESWQLPLTQQRLPIVPEDPYVAQMHHFADVIRGKAKPVLSARDGTVTLASTLAISLSAETGRQVHVDAVLRDGGF